jgi:hypothetical protein
MPEPHSLRSVFPLPLSVPETAMGVTLNAQQHSDSEYVQAIHRWEMGVCWGEYCVLLLAILIHWQDMWKTTAAQTAATCGLHQPNVATSHTVTPVYRFHLTINLQRTVELQYFTYSLKVYYKLEYRSIPLPVPEIHRAILYYLWFQKSGCSLNCCSWPCAHTVTVRETVVSKCVAGTRLLLRHVQGWELIVLQLTLFWFYIFTAVW